MRGTPCLEECENVFRGIIPAYAGNTRVLHRPRGRDRDHPRVCGEHVDCEIRLCELSGSSPRMRGTPTAETSIPSPTGIIPAYAGNTDILKSLLKRIGDHPRVCGEHDVCNSGLAVNQGSSPRMRGTLRTLAALNRYAGDHPRVCGEHVCGQGIHVV